MYFSWHGMYQKNQATHTEKNNNATKSVNIGQWQIEACVCKDDVDSCPLTEPNTFLHKTVLQETWLAPIQ